LAEASGGPPDGETAATELLHMLLFSAIISLTATVMFDFNYPRYGLIRIDAADRLLLQLRESM
jgi:hypothetical protein